MDIFSEELLSTLFLAPDYLPDVYHWLKRQPKENGHISQVSMEKILRTVSYPCWKLFMRTLNAPCELAQAEIEAAEYKLFTETGIARVEVVRFPGEEKKARNLILTEPAKQILSSFDMEQFKKDKLRSNLVHLFAVAAANVYGAIEKDVFIHRFNQYMREPAERVTGDVRGVMYPLRADELDAILVPYTELNIDVLLIDGYLVSRMLYNGLPSDVPSFLSNVPKDIDYYPFTMETLLPYSNLEYFEMTPQIGTFLKKLKEKCLESTEGDLSMVRLIFAPSYLYDWKHIIEAPLCLMLQSLPREEQEELAELFVRAKRSAHCWKLRGHSEEELSPKEEDDVGEFMRVMEGY